MVNIGPQKQKATFGLRAAGFVTFFDWFTVRQQSCVLQESCVQSEVTIFYLDGGSSSVEELKDIVMYIF